MASRGAQRERSPQKASSDHKEPDGVNQEKSPGSNKGPDAGLRSHDHYKTRLPPWRHNLRQRVIPLVRWETPYLAWAQQKLRCPALDSYFAITANLGTHTFFMVFLPILFWAGYPNPGRGITNILAAGVIATGFLKDLVCLPRPLSPPMQRITMSGSAALEYGFPSTHSTNAISVAVYILYTIHSPETSLSPNVRLLIEVLSYVYVLSIVLGRLYCGMHGFMDVGIGGLLGGLLSMIYCVFGQAMDEYLYPDLSVIRLLLVIAVIIALVRIHPEPADDCPCFDDSVAFSGVGVGIELGNWHYITSGAAAEVLPFQFHQMNWLKFLARIAVGVAAILAWREIMKPTLLKGLPPLFRVIERLGLTSPRRFFVQASEYQKVPSHVKDDNVIPSVSEIPSFFDSMRHPRKRSISVGPQSAADVHETLAYREKRRHESSSERARSTSSQRGGAAPADGHVGVTAQRSSASTNAGLASTASARGPAPSLHGVLPSPDPAKIETYADMMGQNVALYTPEDPTSAKDVIFDSTEQHPLPSSEDDKTEHERDKREMFQRLEKLRVRYDVEVVTKLIVYTGIGFLAADGGPLIFDFLGIGIGRRS